MTLKEIKDYFKTDYPLINDFSLVSINKIDNDLEKAICFYNSKRSVDYINKLNLSTYSIKPITILMRYGSNQDVAEQKILELYQYFDKKVYKIDSKILKFQHIYENPINLGTDDKGIIEYSLEINVYYEREVQK